MAACDAGTTTADFKNGVLVRINYFRSMAGVPADVAFDATYSEKSQQAALMMSRNDALDHTPPASWSCYSQEGSEAAGSANLSLGNYGWDAVSSQIRDNGANNTLAGHRRWLLYPQTETMGTGDVPPSPGHASANSLWVFDGNYGAARPQTREDYVAWPPPGYVPYDVVPARWSFSHGGADFGSATVTMTRGGDPVSVVQHPVATGYGENSIVWVADGLNADLWYTRWPAPENDTTYSVTIADVVVEGTPTSFSYDVTVFDPSQRGADEEHSTVSGPRHLLRGSRATYTFTPVSFADSYEVLQAELREGDYLEGGENGAGSLVDHTDPAYELVTGAASATGDYALHLAHPGPASNAFELDRVFIPSESGTLEFASRLGYATADQTVLVQISEDDGTSWKTLYTEAGSGGSGQGVFTSRAISLADHADVPVRIRFLYRFESGSYYSCTDAHCGLLVDDIRVSGAMEIIAAEVVPVDTPLAFSFSKSSANLFALAVRTIAWDGYPGLDWGPMFYLSERMDMRQAVAMLSAIAGGSTEYTLSDVVTVLQVLTGN